MANALEVAKGVTSAAEKPVVGWQDIGKVVQNKLAPFPTYKETGFQRQARIVKAAAEKWRISPIMLWGVYGRETGHGSNIKPSSTGALGPFQFEPETAKAYGYPTGVNEHGVTDYAAFQRQAEAAAHLLAVNGGQQASKAKGNAALFNKYWGEAIAAYNTGSRSGHPEYSVAEVRAAGQSLGKNESNSGREREANIEKEKAEAYPTKISGSAMEKFGELGITLILILAGAILLIYGVAVAVRPREKALEVPKPSLGFGGSLGGLGG